MKLSPQDVKRILEDAYLNVNIKNEELHNPLLNIPEEYRDNEHLFMTGIMLRPEYLSLFCKEILNVELFPLQSLILKELHIRQFPMLLASRGAGKTFMLAIYCWCQMILNPGSKIIMAGAGFRQSKMIFEYMAQILRKAPILQSLQPLEQRSTDNWRFICHDSMTTAIPLGSGDKIRGYRANVVVTDEFDSIPREVFETVLSGFLSTLQNPVESIKQEAARSIIQHLDLKEEVNLDEQFNKLIISGTAGYSFGSFCEYWKRWKKIIHANNDVDKLKEIFGELYSKKITSDKYSIIRVPFELLPKGLMDEAQVARSRASMHSGTYEREFGAVFSDDSTGFFKRSLIEGCTITDHTNFSLLPTYAEKFHAVLYGTKNKRYVMAIDPAAVDDNFAIVIVELWPDHKRIVYCWTTNTKEHREKLKLGVVQENDYYFYCVKKIRSLMKTFNCERIAIDSQGGGLTITEILGDKDRCEYGERPLLPVIIPGKPQETDGRAGEHILNIIHFANYDWMSNANHKLRKDLEDKSVLFPFFDLQSLGLAGLIEDSDTKLYDSLEDCIYDIEELKNELSMIVISKTATGRDRWDTPEVKLPGGKKDRLRKDRYSALLMANDVANELTREVTIAKLSSGGGFAEQQNKDKITGPDYMGPEWFTTGMSDVYGSVYD